MTSIQPIYYQNTIKIGSAVKGSANPAQPFALIRIKMRRATAEVLQTIFLTEKSL